MFMTYSTCPRRALYIRSEKGEGGKGEERGEGMGQVRVIGEA
jgi:hypothetical protein